MRLTLRTLLAYLDDMLDDEDANTLKAKIDESGLAAELITRIQNSVDSRELGAISPDAIGPLENANVMSEYLDSTLSPEQIAEIERLCLESDTSLSEAAACHQILLHDCDILLLDEPTRGIDIGSKSMIYEQIGRLACAGKAIVLVSSYLPELLGVCDRIGVFARGGLVDVRETTGWSEHELLEAAIG